MCSVSAQRGFRVVFLQTVTGQGCTAGREQITSTDGEISILKKHTTKEKKKGKGAGEQYQLRCTERQRQIWVMRDWCWKKMRWAYTVQEKKTHTEICTYYRKC